MLSSDSMAVYINLYVRHINTSLLPWVSELTFDLDRC